MDTSDAGRKSQFEQRSQRPDESLEWLDEQRRRWRLVMESHAVSLIGDEKTLTIPSEMWVRDIYVALHGPSVILRFETFDLSVAFVVTADQAAPLLMHIGRSGSMAQKPVETREEPSPARPTLWPKVSPLAVWALICSSLVFVPILGCVPAAATVVLLLLHRRRVRRAQAWNHSRAICTAAVVFLLGGAVVSVLATTGYLRFSIGSPVSQSRTVPVMPAISSAPDVDEAQTLAFLDAARLEEINWGLLAATLIVMVLSLTVHEAAHATTAWWLGDDFARRLGRVTLNPMSHIDPLGTIILPLILYISDAGVFGWAKPVPVRTEQLSNPHRAHILIAIAGPGSNLLMAAASLALLLGLGTAVSFLAPGAQVANYSTFDWSSPVAASGFPLASVFGPLCTILKLSFMVNVFLAFFNLIPIPPLDGSWVLEHLFPRTLGPIYHRIRPYGFLVFLLLIFSRTNILFYLLTPAFAVRLSGLALLSRCTSLA